jgi:small subunit ribosomal protein S9
VAEQVTEFIATGRRKTSVARVRMKPGAGQVLVNGKSMAEYFQRETLVMHAKAPLREIDGVDKYDIRVRVHGGGLSAQAGALRHGISRALIKIDDTFRDPLKKAGFLTRDPRMVERKKYGRSGARAKFQFSKR